jgi:glycosyltransferase involved in cell wall biosynthesis
MAKRILFLTPHLPYPPHQGGALRNYGLMKGLAERGHELAILSFREPAQDDVDATPLADFCNPAQTVIAPVRTISDRLRDLAAGHADMTRRFWSEAFADTLQNMLSEQQFDVIHMDIEMTGYLPVMQQHAPDAVLVYDALNAEYDLQQRIALQDLRTLKRLPFAGYSLIQARRLRRVESRLCETVDQVFACSQVDANKLAALSHDAPVDVIPNAITVGDYTASAGEINLQRPALVFTGKMDFRPNVDAALWFAEEILPLIQREEPASHFTIVGQKPHARLDVLRARSDVTLTGFVPAIQPYIAAADVYVAPLRMGSGTRFKLLESMALGQAIVSTHIGAEGLGAQDGEHLILADTPQDFADKVLLLLRDKTLREQLATQGRRFVAKYYDWSAIIPRVEAGYGFNN